MQLLRRPPVALKPVGVSTPIASAAVMAHLERARACWNAGDLDGLVATYAPRAALIVEGGLPIVGEASIRQALGPSVRTWAAVSIAVKAAWLDEVGTWVWVETQQETADEGVTHDALALVVDDGDGPRTLLEFWPRQGTDRHLDIPDRLSRSPRTEAGA